MLRQLVVKDEHGHDLRQLQCCYCFSLGIGPLSATSRAADYSIYAVIVYYNDLNDVSNCFVLISVQCPWSRMRPIRYKETIANNFMSGFCVEDSC
jgi:hypothetical protein